MNKTQKFPSQVGSEPFFNESVKVHVFAPVGGRTTIECRVGNLGESAVNPLIHAALEFRIGREGWGGIITGF